MSIEELWSRLGSDSRNWFVENNGDDLIDDVAAVISAAGGTVCAGTRLGDEEIDWIEAVANGEVSWRARPE